MNNWEHNLQEVIDVLKDNGFLWLKGDTRLKYVTIKIDTRDGAFLLFDREGKEIQPKDIFAAKKMLDNRKAEWNV